MGSLSEMWLERESDINPYRNQDSNWPAAKQLCFLPSSMQTTLQPQPPPQPQSLQNNPNVDTDTKDDQATRKGTL